ncbi:MAG: hypothetical protein HYV07_06480 [Deltaproteobacteria bacterium]|nr:hypothetical protein [Deltaproteobacteria bacterium]
MSTIAKGTMTLAFALALLISCGGKGAAGEGCDTPSSTDECESGLICSNDSDEEASCRKICTDQADCAGTENCNGVSGSTTKSCQPR